MPHAGDIDSGSLLFIYNILQRARGNLPVKIVALHQDIF